MNTNETLLNCYGESIDIAPFLRKYKQGKTEEIINWLWDELYHQGDIGTASVAWILEANEIFLKRNNIDWNHLPFIYAVMRSLEELKYIKCPVWVIDQYRPIAITALQHALSNISDKPNEEQQLSILSLTCAITGNYTSFELLEYGWKYEEKLMELDI